MDCYDTDGVGNEHHHDHIAWSWSLLLRVPSFTVGTWGVRTMTVFPRTGSDGSRDDDKVLFFFSREFNSRTDDLSSQMWAGDQSQRHQTKLTVRKCAVIRRSLSFPKPHHYRNCYDAVSGPGVQDLLLLQSCARSAVLLSGVQKSGSTSSIYKT